MLRAFAIFSTALLLSVCAYAQKETEQEAPKVVQVGPSYVIGAGDILVVAIGKEQKELDLTNTQPVRADGMISVPLLKDIRAAGLTPMQLAASITEKLKNHIKDPHVTVVVTKMKAKRSTLTGEFSHGGVMFAPTKPHRGTARVIRDLEDSPQGPDISVPR